MSEKIKIICIAGPTASGKTALGVKAAKAVGGEVVSADSMQIYKDMHIASAAADKTEQEGVPHHLLEFVPYGEGFTVYDYLKRARETVYDIHSRKKVPVIVGGTGLYINSLIDNIELTDVKTDMDLRCRLEEKFDAEGGEKMLSELMSLDPDAAEKLHPNDRRRIVRAFEIFETTGKTKSQQNTASRLSESPFEPLMIGINYADREKLYERINLRVELMLKNGLLDEARAAYEKRSAFKSGAVQAIGHKEFFPFFDGEISMEEATENLKRATRRYAKRQLTWFGARNDINWIYPDTENADERLFELLKEGGYL